MPARLSIKQAAVRLGLLTAVFFGAAFSSALHAQQDAKALLERLGVDRGICVCIVLPRGDAKLPLQLAENSKLQIYVQSDESGYVAKLQREAASAGLLGTRIYVEHGDPKHIHLATNLADGLIVSKGLKGDLPREELLRVIHPGAKALVGEETITKPANKQTDDWSHPYHGPDNNPQSRDTQVKAPFLTQFLAEPWYVPMPQVTVVSGGRMFKALGHIALKRREWPWLNSLVAINAYNGTQLWKRPLTPGFMIHRNTLIATPEVVYLGDDSSCKILDAATGELRDEIKIAANVDADGWWKWMALQDGVLYALVGRKEVIDTTIKGARQVPGWPWSGLGKAYGGKYPWGFGRTLLAIDAKTKKIKWTYKSAEPIDSRVMCLAAGRIYVYSHQKYLASVDAKTGREVWKTTDAEVLAAIGEHDKAQTASKGFASTTYAKANVHGVYFAGPQRNKLAAVSAKDGSLMWEHPHGNYQLVLRDDALYALGRLTTSKKFDYLTGKVLADLECYRGNCTRATATTDSIFTRGYRHTGTMRLDLTSNRAAPRRIPLMRPACQDGVIVSNGQLYWGPWMCDCNHSLVGMISLASAGDYDFAAKATEKERLWRTLRGLLFELDTLPGDWPSYRGDTARQASSPVTIPEGVKQLWQFQPPSAVEPTAPVTAGGLAIWSGMDGVVRTVDAKTGKLASIAYTGGAVRFSPEVWKSRVYVGSSDGWVYCIGARSGRTLWRFRAAPAERKIAVHGRLMSNWPVGGGVLVADGVVYAAAGIASYDGTHVYALDAESGKIRWQNNTSGQLVGQDQVTGVSVQGHLLLHDKRLYLAGGNVVSPAIYDTADGKCLNKLANEWWQPPAGATSKFPTPAKSRGATFQRSPRGRELFLVDGKVRVFDQLLYSPPKYGQSRYMGGHFLQAAAGKIVIRGTTGRIARLAPSKPGQKQPEAQWTNEAFADPQALALCKNVVLIAGKLAGEADAKDDDGPKYQLAALNVADGKPVWTQALPASPVAWGLAVDAVGRVVVTLTDGRVVCFGE